MSVAAEGWAKKRRGVLSRNAKALFVFLADYADPVGWAWPFVETVAEELEVSARTVQRMLPEILNSGLMLGFEIFDRRGGRTRGRVYWFPVEGRGPSAAEIKEFEERISARLSALFQDEKGAWRPSTPVTPVVTGARPTPVTAAVTPPVTPVVTPGVTPAVTPYERKLEPRTELRCSDKSSHPECAGAGDVQPEGEGLAAGYAAVREAYPERGRLGRSSDRLSLAAYVAEVADGADPAVILAGVRAYAADKSLWGSSGDPKAFHTFLSSGAYADIAAARPGGGRPAERRCWPGPREIRDAFVHDLTEVTVWTWLDPCGWRDADRAILTRTGTAAKWLADNAAALLKRFDLNVKIEKVEC